MFKNRWFMDRRGIEGLPMRLIIIVVVAVAVLAAILAMLNMVNPKGTLNVECMSVGGQEGNLYTVSGAGEISDISFNVVVKVTNSEGDPVSGATVTLTGANGAGSGKTGDDGTVTITVQNVKLNANENKEYMDVTVTASGYHEYNEENFIVIARVG